MDVEHELRQEEGALRRAWGKVHRQLRRPFGREPSIIGRMKRARRALILAALLNLFNAGMSLAGTKELMPQVMNIYDRLNQGAISEQQASDELGPVIARLDSFVKKSIENKEYHQALEELHLLELFSVGLQDRDMLRDVLRAQRVIRSSMSEHVDLDKPGVYTDHTKNHIYVIGSIRGIHNHHQRIRAQAFHQLFRQLGGGHVKVDVHGSNVLMTDLQGDTWRFIVSIDEVSQQSKGVTQGIAQNLPLVPLR